MLSGLLFSSSLFFLFSTLRIRRAFHPFRFLLNNRIRGLLFSSRLFFLFSTFRIRRAFHHFRFLLDNRLCGSRQGLPFIPYFTVRDRKSTRLNSSHVAI